MKARSIRLGLAGLLGLCTLSLTAADSNIAGDWKVSGDIAGNALDVVCTFAQDSAAKLTGECKGENGGRIIGEVSGSKVTFRYDVDYQGQSYTLVFLGNLKSATAMDGTIDVGVANGGFTAKKQ